MSIGKKGMRMSLGVRDLIIVIEMCRMVLLGVRLMVVIMGVRGKILRRL